jgi:hypothetical protein
MLFPRGMPSSGGIQIAFWMRFCNATRLELNASCSGSTDDAFSLRDGGTLGAPRARDLECARRLQHEPIAQAAGDDLQSDRQPRRRETAWTRRSRLAG